jgi:hypothetical protein
VRERECVRRSFDIGVGDKYIRLGLELLVRRGDEILAQFYQLRRFEICFASCDCRNSFQDFCLNRGLRLLFHGQK